MTAGNDNQARLWLDQDHEAPEVLSTATGTAAVYSRRSPDKESAND